VPVGSDSCGDTSSVQQEISEADRAGHNDHYTVVIISGAYGLGPGRYQVVLQSKGASNRSAVFTVLCSVSCAHEFQPIAVKAAAQRAQHIVEGVCLSSTVMILGAQVLASSFASPTGGIPWSLAGVVMSMAITNVLVAAVIHSFPDHTIREGT